MQFVEPLGDFGCQDTPDLTPFVLEWIQNQNLVWKLFLITVIYIYI